MSGRRTERDYVELNLQRVIIYRLSRERMRKRSREERHIYIVQEPLGFADEVGHVGHEAAVPYCRYGGL